MNSKPMTIPKLLVWRAWHVVKAANGGPGVDQVTLELYENDLNSNLYMLWNRMSSGTYFPSAVKQVAIPKAKGVRYLGIPTVNDRIAQTVVRLQLEDRLEKVFLPESYGARTGRNAHQAVRTCRERCWKQNWVIDLDLKSFFDSIDHELLMRAVAKHQREPWEKLYILRWLKAPVELTTGERRSGQESGIPQGGPISPLLSNLFLHYALDLWLRSKYPEVKFERYLDDVIIHCQTERQAESLLKQIESRLSEVKLSLNREKTRIVYSGKCGVPREPKAGPRSFTFLGFEFKPRKMRTKDGKLWTGISAGVGQRGKKKLAENLRKNGALRRTNLKLQEVALSINPIIRGWINYFKEFRPSEMAISLTRIDLAITKWMRRKFKLQTRQSVQILTRIKNQQPRLFAHWGCGHNSAIGGI